MVKNEFYAPNLVPQATLDLNWPTFKLIWTSLKKLNRKKALYFVLKQDLLFSISHSRALSDNRVSQKEQNSKRYDKIVLDIRARDFGFSTPSFEQKLSD